MSTSITHTCTPQLPPPPGFEAFAVRDITSWFEGPTFDVIYCDPETWGCYYIQDSVFSTAGEAKEMADALNSGVDTSLPASQLYSLDC